MIVNENKAVSHLLYWIQTSKVTLLKSEKVEPSFVNWITHHFTKLKSSQTVFLSFKKKKKKDPFFVSFMAWETKAAFEEIFELGQPFVAPL